MDTSDTSKPVQPRRPYRLWLAGIAAGTFVAVMLAPSTGWVARTQVATQLGIGNSSIGNSLGQLGIAGISNRPDEEELRPTVVNDHPSDFPLALAVAMETGRQAQQKSQSITGQVKPRSLGTAIRTLENRFPNQPGLYANAIRLDTMGIVRIFRPEKALLTGDAVDSRKPIRALDPEDLNVFDRNAAEGERLEPDNAYFPTMRAAGYFAANKDSEAIASLLRAADCTHWNEHLDDEVTGKWRLAELETGGKSAIHRTAIAAAVLLPHLSQIRDTAHIATYKAMLLEQAGHPADGARIRIAVMRVGDLMRADCTTLIGNLVGVSAIHIATDRPGGAPALKPGPTVGSSITVYERDEYSRQRFALLAAYWEKNGLAGDVALARDRIDTGLRMRDLARKMVDASPFSELTVAKLVLMWSGGSVLLANAWWLLIGAGIGSLALARRRTRGTERMPRSGPFVLAVAALLFVLFCGRMVLHQSAYIGGMAWLLSAMSGMEGAPRHGNEQVPAFLAMALGFALPAIIAMGATIVSVVRRVPIRAGMARGFSRVGVPAACLMILAFSSLCVVTAQYENRVNEGLEQTLKDEGRYLARLTGHEWPGPVQ